MIDHLGEQLLHLRRRRAATRFACAVASWLALAAACAQAREPLLRGAGDFEQFESSGATVAGLDVEHAGGPQSPGCIREFWIVNTRCAPTCGNLAAGFDRLTYWKLEPCQGWVQRDRAAFVAADPTLPTTFFVHGNGYTHPEAVSEGMSLARGVGQGLPAFRFVIWSWSSERIHCMRPVNSARTKATRSELQGYYLARLIDELDPQVPLSLVGHSFGARTVVSALQTLATGQIAGQRLTERKHPGWRPIQIALLAAAIDQADLLPGRRYGSALTQAERAVITVNPQDFILRLFTRFANGGAAQLGVLGIGHAVVLGSQRSEVQIVPVSCWLGRHHVLRHYQNTSPVVAQVRPFFFWAAPSTAATIAGSSDTPSATTPPAATIAAE